MWHQYNMIVVILCIRVWELVSLSDVLSQVYFVSTEHRASILSIIPKSHLTRVRNERKSERISISFKLRELNSAHWFSSYIQDPSHQVSYSCHRCRHDFRLFLTLNGNNQLDYENLRFIQSSILLFHELGLGKVNKRLGRNKMTFTSGLKQEI